MGKTHTIFFDCFSGASGDMIVGALLDAGLPLEYLQSEIAKLKLLKIRPEAKKVSKNHIAATQFEVFDEGKKVYRHLSDLNQIIDQSTLETEIKEAVKRIFQKIAEAEAKVHGMPIEKVHFHEIGAVDTIVDVVGALVGLRFFETEKIFCSKLNVGTGFVQTEHGKFPVPAPATVELLKGVPCYSDGTIAELVTPTGAAILAEIATEFGDLPQFNIEKIGYGAGQKNLEHPNVLRVLLGESATICDSDLATIIETNIDDMNPQIFESVTEKLLQAGALDVFLTNTIMKKGRPAILLTLICEPKNEGILIELLFRETTSIGLRFRHERRAKLRREITTVQTSLGPVLVKVSSLGSEILNRTPEYDDCKKIATENKIALKEVLHRINLEINP